MNRQRKRGDRMNTELYELLTSAQLQQRETAEGGRALLPSRFCRAEPVKGGVRGIFNFAPVYLHVPDTVTVRNEDIAASMALLANSIQKTEHSPSAEDEEYKEGSI